MLTLVPAILLLVMAGVVLILNRVRPNFGSAWLVSVSASIIALGLLIAFHWWVPAGFGSNNWLPTSSEGAQIFFQVDNISWSYGVSLLGLLMAVLLTAPVRLKYRSNPNTWAANLAIAGTALLGVLAATPLTLVLTWSILDLIDLVVTLASNTDLKVNRAALVAYIFKLAGALLVIWAMGINRAAGEQLTLVNAQPLASFYLLLAIGLRLGVLPLSLPYYSEALRRRGIGSMIRLAGPAASLGLLARLPATVAPLNISPFLLALVGLSVLYGAGMWLASPDEVNGRQYWVLALAGMAVGTAIRGQPQASLAWGVALILSGGLLFLYSTRPPISMVLPLLGLIGMSGLPFSPAASGWAGMIVLPFTLPDLLFILAHALLLIGYIRHLMRPGDQPSGVEGWTQVSYSLGLFLLAGLGWVIGIWGWAGSFTIGIWWASLITIVVSVSLGLVYFIFRRRGWNEARIQQGWFWRVSARIGGVISAIFRLNWLYSFFWQVFSWLQKIISLMTEMLEGAGGILWVLVLLVLLITVVRRSLQ